MSTAPLLLRAAEVAAALGCSRAKTYDLMASGVLPTVRFGRAVRVPARALEEWIGRHTIGGDLPVAPPEEPALRRVR